jgi:hypothetical protein
MSEPERSHINRDPIVYGVISVVLTLVVVQLWLFSATMNAFLGGDFSVVWPAAGASLGCLGVNVWLLAHFRVLKK